MKAPSWEIDFKVDLYALKEYKGWTDEELGKRLGISAVLWAICAGIPAA